MKPRFFAVLGGLALACAALTPALADQASDPLAGLTTIKETQLDATRGGTLQHHLKLKKLPLGENGLIRLREPVISKLTGFGDIVTHKADTLAGGLTHLGGGLGDCLTGPVFTGLNLIGNHLGTDLGGLQSQ